MSAAAIQCVKKFRLQQINGVQNHVARYGPIKGNKGALPNPFLPQFNGNTGRWHPPKVSLRRQADLVKKAKLSNTLHLLPLGPKNAFRIESPVSRNVGEDVVPSADASVPKKGQEEPWSLPVEWVAKLEAKEVPGAHIGNRLYAAKKRMFKGHKWERVKESRKKKREILLRDMAKRVANYKAYYHRRRPNPLKPARSAKSPKLPF